MMKRELRAEARRICAKLDVSVDQIGKGWVFAKSSVSIWVRDVRVDSSPTAKASKTHHTTYGALNAGARVECVRKHWQTLRLDYQAAGRERAQKCGLYIWRGVCFIGPKGLKHEMEFTLQIPIPT